MSHLLLSHLSQENNCEQKVQELFNSNAGHTEIIVAGRHQETHVYSIKGIHTTIPVVQKKPHQLRLFADLNHEFQGFPA